MASGSGSQIARKEVSEWLKTQPKDGGEGTRIEIDSVKEEERTMVFKNNDNAFSITFQTDYPNSTDEYLFVETESKVTVFVSVVNDLREFIYGKPTSLTITEILDQLKHVLLKRLNKEKNYTQTVNNQSS
ncbi:unnamed protein product, partial [Choristocarpus tenellus]